MRRHRPHSSISFRGLLATACAALVSMGSPATAAPQPGTDLLASNVFATALVNGRASAPIPEAQGQFAKTIASLQARSGSSESISIVAQRVGVFVQQPGCGRVRFALAQLEARIVFTTFSGQLNICRDGQPPLRTCADHPGRLVPPAATCANGQAPIDTDEVAAAIRSATAGGGLTHDEMLRQWAHRIATHVKAAASSASGTATTGTRKETK